MYDEKRMKIHRAISSPLFRTSVVTMSRGDGLLALTSKQTEDRVVLVVGDLAAVRVLDGFLAKAFLGVITESGGGGAAGLDTIGSVRVPPPVGKGTFGADGHTSTPLPSVGNEYLYSRVQVPLNKQVSQVLASIDRTQV